MKTHLRKRWFSLSGKYYLYNNLWHNKQVDKKYPVSWINIVMTPWYQAVGTKN
jgi:hypothetical protein